MLSLAFKNLVRRPLRNALTVLGFAVAVAMLACLAAFGHGYQRALGTELDRMGLQMMLVPLGCPYDAAARVLKGRELENSLPESALEAARRDPAVAISSGAATATAGSRRAASNADSGSEFSSSWPFNTRAAASYGQPSGTSII